MASGPTGRQQGQKSSLNCKNELNKHTEQENQDNVVLETKVAAKKHQAVQLVFHLVGSYILLTEAGREITEVGWSWRKLRRRRIVKGLK